MMSRLYVFMEPTSPKGNDLRERGWFDRYILFELRPAEVYCNGYGDVTMPERRRWRAGSQQPSPRPT